MFSTKAEYGVRVMVELARRGGDEPVPLAEVEKAWSQPDDGRRIVFVP